MDKEKETIIREFIARQHGVLPHLIEMELTPLKGGLEGCDVHVVRLTRSAAQRMDGSRIAPFVVKTVPRSNREVAAYTALARSGATELAPRLLGVQSAGSSMMIFLECVKAACPWPWRTLDTVGSVLERLHVLHSSSGLMDNMPEDAKHWYESSLEASAEATVEASCAAHHYAEAGHLRYLYPALRRVALVFPAMRRQLLESAGKLVVLHGDVHPGNVMVRRSQGVGNPVFLDWARWRVGSPLEDVCSWIHTLAFWEPVATRFHDTLFERYFQTTAGRRFDSEARALSAFAAASNALAGVLRYHMWRMTSGEAADPRERVLSIRAVRYWLNVIRRADRHWRN